MPTYYLNNEQKKLLDEFAREAMDNIMCDLADDIESPLDPYDQAGNYDRAKMEAMLVYIAEQIKSHI